MSTAGHATAVFAYSCCMCGYCVSVGLLCPVCIAHNYIKMTRETEERAFARALNVVNQLGTNADVSGARDSKRDTDNIHIVHKKIS